MMPRKPKKVIELFIAFSLSKKKQTEPQAEQDHYFWLSSSHLFIFESSTIKKKQNTLRTLCNQPHKMQNLFFKQKMQLYIDTSLSFLLLLFFYFNNYYFLSMTYASLVNK